MKCKICSSDYSCQNSVADLNLIMKWSQSFSVMVLPTWSKVKLFQLLIESGFVTQRRLLYKGPT